MSPQPPTVQRPDPTATRLWVSAVSLVRQAEELTQRGATVDYTSAVILADVAAETLLGLLAGPAPTPPKPSPGQPHTRLPPDGFRPWLATVARRLKMKTAVVQQLENARDVRNNVVHGGLAPGRIEAEKATAATRTLLELVPRGLRAIHLLPRRAGLADAIASVLQPHPVAGYLERAQRNLDRQRDAEAIEEAAGAFYTTLSSLHPGLLRTSQLVAPSSRVPEMGHLFDQMKAGLEAVEEWLTPMALGVNPTEFERLRQRLPSALPSVIRPGFSHYCWGDRSDTPEARQLVEEVGWLVLRIWERGALSPNVPPPPWVGAVGRELISITTSAVLARGGTDQAGGCVLLVIGDPDTRQVSISVPVQGVVVLGASRVLLDGVPVEAKVSPPWTLTVDLGAATQPRPARELFVGTVRFTVDATAALGSMRTEVSTTHEHGGATRAIASVGRVVDRQ